MRQTILDDRRSAGLGLSVRLLLCSVCLAHSAMALLRAQQNDGAIYGRITDSRGQPQRLLVHLAAEGDVPAGDVFTDSNGQYTFSGLPNGTYWVVVEAKDYRPVRQYVMLDLRIHPKAQANIALELLERDAQKQNQIIAGSTSSYEVSAKRPGRSFDPKAVREFETGNEKQRNGDFDGAISHYQKALRVDPDFYPALDNLGAMLERKRDYAQAEGVFLKSLKINPDDGEAYINLGHLLLDEGRYAPAVERLEEGVKRSPRSPVGRFLLGSSYLKLGDLVKAEPNLKEAYSLDPSGMARARLQLANLYLKRQDMAAASAELEGYLEANPSDPQAPAIKKMLASIAAHKTN